VGNLGWSMPRIRTKRLRRAKRVLTVLSSVAVLGCFYWVSAPLPWRPAFEIERRSWTLRCTPEYVILARLNLDVVPPGKTAAEFDRARARWSYGASDALRHNDFSSGLTQRNDLLPFTPGKRPCVETSDGFWYSFKVTYVPQEGIALACLLLAALPSAWLWWRDRPFPAGCCTKCGYDLRGGVSPACPECAAPVTEREPLDAFSE